MKMTIKASILKSITDYRFSCFTIESIKKDAEKNYGSSISNKSLQTYVGTLFKKEGYIKYTGRKNDFGRIYEKVDMAKAIRFINKPRKKINVNKKENITSPEMGEAIINYIKKLKKDHLNEIDVLNIKINSLCNRIDKLIKTNRENVDKIFEKNKEIMYYKKKIKKENISEIKLSEIL